jgi:hypothetical protein
MKKYTLKTISTLSLFVLMSVSTANVQAFPTCPGCSKPAIQYAVSTSDQLANRSTAPDASAITEVVSATNSEPADSVDSSTFIWTHLALFWVSLL